MRGRRREQASVYNHAEGEKIGNNTRQPVVGQISGSLFDEVVGFRHQELMIGNSRHARPLPT